MNFLKNRPTEERKSSQAEIMLAEQTKLFEEELLSGMEEFFEPIAKNQRFVVSGGLGARILRYFSSRPAVLFDAENPMDRKKRRIVKSTNYYVDLHALPLGLVDPAVKKDEILQTYALLQHDLPGFIEKLLAMKDLSEKTVVFGSTKVVFGLFLRHLTINQGKQSLPVFHLCPADWYELSDKNLQVGNYLSGNDFVEYLQSEAKNPYSEVSVVIYSTLGELGKLADQLKKNPKLIKKVGSQSDQILLEARTKALKNIQRLPFGWSPVPANPTSL